MSHTVQLLGRSSLLAPKDIKEKASNVMKIPLKPTTTCEEITLVVVTPIGLRRDRCLTESRRTNTEANLAEISLFGVTPETLRQDRTNVSDV